MKKLLAIILALVCLVGVVGCSDEHTDTADNYSSDYGNNETSSETASICNHDYAPATCTTPATCTLCGETNGSANGHSYGTATCKAPAKCTVCGETGSQTGDHTYNDKGDCTVCGAVDPKFVKIREALEKCERYASYSKIEGEMILINIDLYRINGKTSELIEMQEHVQKIDGYLSKMRSYCQSINELYPLYSACDLVAPVVTSGNLAKIKTYATQATRIKITYDISCDSWGVK